MKAGDWIQLRDTDNVRVNDEHVVTAHWVFAKVIQANADGSLIAQIDHAGNPAHEDRRLLVPGEFRTKEDVLKLRELATRMPESYAELSRKDGFVALLAKARGRDMSLAALGSELARHYEAQAKEL